MSYLITDGHFFWCSERKKCSCKLSGYGVVILLASMLAIFEIWGGHTSGSISLLVDAVHVLSDVVVYLASAWAFRLKMKGSSHHAIQEIDNKWGVLNSWILTTAALGMISYAFIRLLSQDLEIPTERMLLVAGIGLAANMIMYVVLKALRIEHEHGHESKDHVHESAILHTISDAIISVGVVLVGSYIFYFPEEKFVQFLDPCASILICTWLLYQAHLIRVRIRKRIEHCHN